MVADLLCHKYHRRFSRGKGPYKLINFELNGEPVYLMKPLTYMNLSGTAVRQVIDQIRFSDFSRMLVISDDVNIPFGTLRLRGSGSSGGQKGLKSIITALQQSDFARLRIGIGDSFSDAADYVLSPFSRREKKDLPIILHHAASAVELFILQGLDIAMNTYNRNVLED